MSGGEGCQVGGTWELEKSDLYFFFGLTDWDVTWLAQLGKHRKTLELFTTIAWFVWTRRNQFRIGEASLQPHRIFETTCNFLSKFQQNPSTQLPKQALLG